MTPPRGYRCPMRNVLHSGKTFEKRDTEFPSYEGGVARRAWLVRIPTRSSWVRRRTACCPPAATHTHAALPGDDGNLRINHLEVSIHGKRPVRLPTMVRRARRHFSGSVPGLRPGNSPSSLESPLGMAAVKIRLQTRTGRSGTTPPAYAGYGANGHRRAPCVRVQRAIAAILIVFSGGVPVAPVTALVLKGAGRATLDHARNLFPARSLCIHPRLALRVEYGGQPVHAFLGVDAAPRFVGDDDAVAFVTVDLDGAHGRPGFVVRSCDCRS